MTTKKDLKGQLKTCGQKSVKAWVIRWVCGSVGVTPTDRLSDLSRHGCGSGMISELIYTRNGIRCYPQEVPRYAQCTSRGAPVCDSVPVDSCREAALSLGRIWLSQSDRVSSQQAKAKWSETNQIGIEGENS